MEYNLILPNVNLDTRELWWNLHGFWHHFVFYALAVVSVGFFLTGLYKRLKTITNGKSMPYEPRTNNLLGRLKYVFQYAFLQKKTAKRKVPGLAHIGVFLGFMTLWIVTNIVAVQDYTQDIGPYFFQGSFYKLISVAAEIGGLFLLLGVIAFTVRRYIINPRELDRRQHDWIQPAYLLAFVITGFLTEALRIAGTNASEPYAFIGNSLASLFRFMTPADQASAHQSLWWLHAVLTFTFIALLPRTKFIHIMTAPLSIFFKSRRARGELNTPFKLMDMLEAEEKGIEIDEEQFNAGVFNYEDLSWKTLMDSEACTACGRCHVECPAVNTDKPLSPKHLMLDIKQLSYTDTENKSDIYSHISEDVLWSCTTCYACVEACPVLIEHVDSIVDMRRGLLASNKAPANLQSTLKNVRTKSNPWGLPAADRLNWIKTVTEDHNLDIQVLAKNSENFEYLYWVGSPGAYDSKNMQVTIANARLFSEAGLKFAVLGKEEQSSGDVARRAGDEAMYQEIVIENIEIMKAYGVKKIITQCPHVYNTFKNEYPNFGLENVEVYHHSEILADLIANNKLRPSIELNETITYHDPCYLARYNRVMDPPRYILENIPGVELKAIAKEKTQSTCCGGGGAQIWYEMPGSEINAYRLEQLAEHSPDKVAVACPYCNIMLSSANTTGIAKAPDIEDVAVILSRSVFRKVESQPATSAS